MLRRSLLLSPLLATPVAAQGVDPFAALEARHGGRLGVGILDVEIRGVAGALPRLYRGDERFPICSTYKLLAAAAVLARVDRGEESLGRVVVYGADALVTYSPLTERHAGAEGMTVGALCDAAITLSDNGAGNLLFAMLGGPAGLTAFLRAQGDRETRLDRVETALNEAAPGDPRDTTTPRAMLGSLHRLLFGSVLSPASREQLLAWMVGCRTGGARIRAGVPGSWRSGDKTGSGERGTTNDVAVLWPPAPSSPTPLGGPGILVVGFYTGSAAAIGEREAVLAEVGRLAVGLASESIP